MRWKGKEMLRSKWYSLLKHSEFDGWSLASVTRQKLLIDL